MQATSLFTLIKGLWQHISLRRRYQFILMIGLTLVSSVAEIVSLGAVVPFIGILTEPEGIFNHRLIHPLALSLGIHSASELVLPLIIGFAVAAIVAGVVRLLLLWVSIRLVKATTADISLSVYSRTLYQPYYVHVSRSSSEVISSISIKVGDATVLLSSLVSAITSTALFGAILATLIAIDPMVAIIAMIAFGSSYAFIAWRTRRLLFKNSCGIANEQTQVIKSLQEGLGAIRDVLLDGTQKIYCNIYSKSIRNLQRAQSEVSYISQSPRYVMEALGMVLISLFVLVLSKRPGGVATALPVLAALALGAQRLLPLLQQLYGSWTAVIGSQASLIDVLKLLEQPLPEEAHCLPPEPLVFHSAIQFDHLSFSYNEASPVLDDINLVIPKGSRIGFVGTTGSGKSTTLDLLMGLLNPTNGNVLVDGSPIRGKLVRAWQRTIAHVPQNIYLGDVTIAENIAFGTPLESIDMEQVRKAAKQAQIADFIESRPEGYQAMVGERGVRLSGGQRQRIGIARALYKEASVFVFDEATSALDNETEKEVINAIKNLDKNLTIFIVAHRLTTLQHCNTVVRLEKGKIVEQGPYEQFITNELSVSSPYVP